MKKILAIGNSFSEDATRYIHQIAASAGEECLVVNLYMGGCPLWYHAHNLRTNVAEFRYERNGEITQRLVSTAEAMAEEDWDVVTIQQASPLSGKKASFSPYGEELIAFAAEKLPGAKVYFHQTWAYADNSSHQDFIKYGFSRKQMYGEIVSASRAYAEEQGIGLIPTGEVIETLRADPLFNTALGGTDLCRDGFHLSLTYGRFAAGVTWFAKLFGKKDFDYIPEGTDRALCEVIKQTVYATVKD